MTQCMCSERPSEPEGRPNEWRTLLAHLPKLGGKPASFLEVMKILNNWENIHSLAGGPQRNSVSLISVFELKRGLGVGSFHLTKYFSLLEKPVPLYQFVTQILNFSSYTIIDIFQEYPMVLKIDNHQQEAVILPFINFPQSLSVLYVVLLMTIDYNNYDLNNG